MSNAQRTLALGGGIFVPYPEPAGVAATKMGQANRRRDTKPETRLRSLLHRRGMRFRVDYLIHGGSVRVRPDVVFTRSAVVVFVDGCFWHGCPEHQRIPRRNRGYWAPKLQANIDRDRRVGEALTAAGWRVVRIWEHENPEKAADRVESLVRLPREEIDQATQG